MLNVIMLSVVNPFIGCQWRLCLCGIMWLIDSSMSGYVLTYYNLYDLVSHRDLGRHIESLVEIKYWRDFNKQCVYEFFITLIKVLFIVHIKHCVFQPSANVKPMSNDLVLSMPRQCMFAHYIFSLLRCDLYVSVV
jgi:hypothetical protein